MRFVYGVFVGAAVSCAFGVTVTKAFTSAEAKASPEYRGLEHPLILAEWEKDRLATEVAEQRLLLDAARRSVRDPVNPVGPVVPAEDRIPPQQLPTTPQP